jgi:integrase
VTSRFPRSTYRCRRRSSICWGAVSLACPLGAVGQGRKDRHAMLSPQLLELLPAWWREGRRLAVLLPRGWLFYNRAGR